MSSEYKNEECEIDYSEDQLNLVFNQSQILEYKKVRSQYTSVQDDDFNFTELIIEEEKNINETKTLSSHKSIHRSEQNLNTKMQQLNQRYFIKAPLMKSKLMQQRIPPQQCKPKVEQKSSKELKQSLILQVTQEQNKLLLQESYEEQHFEKQTNENLKYSLTKLILLSKYQPSTTLLDIFQKQNYSQRLSLVNDPCLEMKNSTKRSHSSQEKPNSRNNKFYLSVESTSSKNDRQILLQKKTQKERSKEFKIVFY